MIALSIPSVSGIAATALALMLLVKVAFSPSADRTGKFLLLVFLAGLLGMVLNSLYFLLLLHLRWPHLSFLWLFLVAWIGPAFWFYTARTLGLGLEPLGRPWVWYWAPGIVLQAGLFPYLVLSGEAKIEVLTGDAGRYFLFVYLFLYAQIALHVLLVHRALRRHRALVAATDERQELRTDLGWIRLVTYGFAGYLLVDGVVPHLRVVVPGVSLSVAMVLHLFIIIVVFHATTHGQVYPFISAKVRGDPKYVNSGLRADTARHYLGKLERLMQEEQPHLDSDLSLDKLAALLRVHPHHLSQALNDQLGRNFYDYVNGQRVAHARKLLLEQPDLPVIDVAIASGYNNKNSFYNSFRRFVGMTPSGFRQQHVRSGTKQG